MKTSEYIKLAASIIICELAGVIGSFFTIKSIPIWYENLARPALNPPSWVFGPVWTTLFALMGIALYLVWKQRPKLEQDIKMLKIWKLAVLIFFIQLILNTFWSIIFFGSTSLTINGLNNIGIAFIEIIVLWLAIFFTIIYFSKISPKAAWLLVPYILWVSFAVYLNYSIWQLSKEPSKTYCTLEAKLCPDGSYVGRTGPDCQFAPCP